MNAKELINLINDFVKNTDKSKDIEGYNAKLINVPGAIGVAVLTENENVVINEKFNAVSIRSAKIQYHNTEKLAVILSTDKQKLSEKYGAICLDFISPENREIIQNNPLEWFKGWSELLGDAKKNKMAYDVVGEMKCLLEFKKLGENPKWDSTEAGTFDIACSDKIYEVKSSVIKGSAQITIHNQFQIDYENLNVPLYVAFVRLEKNCTGVSIDDLAKELVNAGFDGNKIENYLKDIGYYEGKEGRYKKFLIHEIRLYKVDDKFPKITASSFKNDEIPNGVLKYEYTISLDGLEYSKLGEN